MTEAEWLSCTDPRLMLKFLRGKVSDRKLRLYFCGGCRCITHLFVRPESLTAVEVGERFADGEVGQEELNKAEWDAESPALAYDLDKQLVPHISSRRSAVAARLVEMGALPESALSGGEWEVDEATKERLMAAASLGEFCAATSPGEDWGLSYLSQVDWPARWLFDCIFGNPFRTTALAPDWRTPTVISLAQAAYDIRPLPAGTLDNDRLAILADALEDADCDDADILAHCRKPGLHVRGCWVIDLLTGRE
jgi:hypothetical protein